MFPISTLTCKELTIPISETLNKLKKSTTLLSSVREVTSEGKPLPPKVERQANIENHNLSEQKPTEVETSKGTSARVEKPEL